jgi:hypothetical protein
MHTGFWREIQKEREHWKNLDVGYILKKIAGVVRTGLIWHRVGTSDDGHEPSDSINWWLFKKG